MSRVWNPCFVFAILICSSAALSQEAEYAMRADPYYEVGDIRVFDSDVAHLFSYWYVILFVLALWRIRVEWKRVGKLAEPERDKETASARGLPWSDLALLPFLGLILFGLWQERYDDDMLPFYFLWPLGAMVWMMARSYFLTRRLLIDLESSNPNAFNRWSRLLMTMITPIALFWCGALVILLVGSWDHFDEGAVFLISVWSLALLLLYARAQFHWVARSIRLRQVTVMSTFVGAIWMYIATIGPLLLMGAAISLSLEILDERDLGVWYAMSISFALLVFGSWRTHFQWRKLMKSVQAFQPEPEPRSEDDGELIDLGAANEA